MMRVADLQAPVNGMLWKFNAINGEQPSAGDPIVSLVDCKRQFVLAEIPEERLPDIALNQTARFRLTGESVERTGTVLLVSGDPQHNLDPKLAAVPAPDTPSSWLRS